MKVFCGVLFIFVFVSCEYNDLPKKSCFIASEEFPGVQITYGYNGKYELSSYSAPNIISSVLTYDDKGRIISELDNGNIQITYSYDTDSNLILWTEIIDGYPYGNRVVKYFYNATGQDTLIQFYKYDILTSDYYLSTFTRLQFPTTSTKNYSTRKTYDGSSNLLRTEEYQWDSHPNPYLTNPFFINELPPANNIMQYTIETPGAQPATTIYEYAYNSNGFPIQQTIVGYNGFLHTYSYTNCQ